MRELRPHGTIAAYRRHQRHGEKTCDACRTEYNRRRRSRAGTGPGRRRRGGKPGRRWADPQPCGTPAAYQRHIRYGERPCFSCRQAKTRYDQDRRAAAA